MSQNSPHPFPVMAFTPSYRVWRVHQIVHKFGAWLPGQLGLRAKKDQKQLSALCWSDQRRPVQWQTPSDAVCP